MISLTLPSLTDFLKQNNYDVRFQPETGQLYFALMISGQEFPFFLRIFGDNHLLQLLVFIPCHPKVHLVPDVARLLHMLNKEIDVPGFGMDEVANALFYRVMIPTENQEIHPEILKTFLLTMERVCQMFAPPICAVALGHTSLKEIIQKSQELQQKKSEGKA